MGLINKKSLFTAAALAVASMSSAVFAAPVWQPFIIRTVGGAITPVVPVGTSDGSAFTVQIDESGEKAGYGTSYFDGSTLSSLTSVNYVRVDPGLPDPYLNIWITDGTHSAVIAPVVNMMNGGGYTSNDVNGQNIQSLGFNIYETDFSNLGWLGIAGGHRGDAGAQAFLHSDGSPVLVSEIAGMTIDDPGVYSGFVGTGAPKNNNGFNLVFGDTQGNFLNPIPYSIANVEVPEPTTVGLLAVGAVGLLARRRTRVAK